MDFGSEEMIYVASFALWLVGAMILGFCLSSVRESHHHNISSVAHDQETDTLPSVRP
jgi:hypothetical protein